MTQSSSPGDGQALPAGVIEFQLINDVEPYGTYGVSWYCCNCGKELGYNTFDRTGEPLGGVCRFCESDDISWCEWGDVTELFD